MKRFLGLLMCLFLLAAAAGPALGQTRRTAQRRDLPRYERRYDERRYDERYRDDRSFWEKHRDKVTVAGGAAAGAVVGGVAGGKKGAIIGAIVGAAGSALYTYKLRDREDDRRY